MRVVLRALLVVSISVSSAQAFAADEEGYFSFDASRVNASFDGDERSPKMLRGRVGIDLVDEPRITLESQLAYNLNGEEQKTDYFCSYVDLGCDTSYSLKYFVGMYLGIELSMGTDFFAYAHAGYASAQISGTTYRDDDNGVYSPFILEANQTSPSYAVGVAFALPYHLHGFIEYGRWLNSDSIDISGISIGVRFPIARDDR